MSRIDLTVEERPILIETLHDAISDIRMEVAATDASSFRESLKRKERILKQVLARLEPSPDAMPHHPEFPADEQE